MRRLEGLRAIVTGAGSGIGRASALRLAQEGARVMVADVDPENSGRVAEEIGSESAYRRTDVASAEDVEELIRDTERIWGGLDIMVNNAGVGLAATVPETSEEDWDRVIAVNLKGVFWGMKYAIPAIRNSQGGSVINVASNAALVGLPDRAAYSAAKGGLLALTRAAATDHIREGVRINCVAPGTTDTPWIERITTGYEDPTEARAKMRARQPHGRFVTSEEVAAMIAYLASEESSSCVGACMVVDGGMTAQ